MTRTAVRALAIGIVALCLGRAGLTTPAPQTPAATSSAQDFVDESYHAAYALEYASALASARRAVDLAPADPRTHVALASILWLEILFERGSVSVEFFLRGTPKPDWPLPKVPPDLDAQFTQEITRAIGLADAGLAREPSNVDAMDTAGACYALQASYLASVRGSTSAAFHPAKRAFELESDVLAADPGRAHAAFIVGIYRYVVSTFGLPERLFAYLAGFSGGKERGLALMEQAARAGNVEAAVSLLLVYAREGRHVDAWRTATGLEATYPANRLFTLEAGSAAVRAGLGDTADAALSRGLAALDRDTRPTFPGERAMWLYERGMARTERGHLDDARMDLTAALSHGPVGWIEGRIHLQLGRIDDVTSRRADALTEYRQARRLCDAEHDDPCHQDADQLERRPFHAKS